MQVDPVAPWNQLLGQIPILNNIFAVLGVLGVILLIVSVGGWLWSRRRGGSGGFPWMMLIIAGILMAPKVLIPLILWLLGVLITLIVMAFEAAQSIFG